VASSADAMAARSFSTSASARASLDANESRSVAAAATVLLAAMAQSSAEYPAVSNDVRADASHATAAAAATRATTSCISNWARSAWISRVAWDRL
jgi:hypothetical protein